MNVTHTPTKGQPADSYLGRRGVVRPLSIAPMMEWTDRHYRFMMRQITRCTLLYTEMITASAIVMGQKEGLLRYDPIEHPVVIQLGGSDPKLLREAASICEDWGYDEINLNVGCPSDRVQNGSFGACLMAEPGLVATLVEEMKKVVSIPVTVKHRIGIDGLERYEDMENFVRIVNGAGCDRFIVHARIAVLGGLSPKENRTIPPLRYEDIKRLKEAFPALWIEGNGQIKSLTECQEKLTWLDGVMLGRAAYENPYLFAEADSVIFGQADPGLSRKQVVLQMIPYIERLQRDEDMPIKCVTRHMLNLIKGVSGARHWRRRLSEKHNITDPTQLFEEAMSQLRL